MNYKKIEWVQWIEMLKCYGVNDERLLILVLETDGFPTCGKSNFLYPYYKSGSLAANLVLARPNF